MCRLRIKTLTILTALILSVIVAYFLVESMSLNESQSQYCPNLLGSRNFGKTNVPVYKYGFLTKYLLPAGRYPNGITFAPDGSVWFGEEGLPGLAHMWLNGTLEEYLFPGKYAGNSVSQCYTKTEIGSIVLLNNYVWSTDTSKNRIIALDPGKDDFKIFYLNTANARPYYLTSGPDGSVWFTELIGSKIGVIFANGTIREFGLPTGLAGTPTEIKIINSSFAVYSDAGLAGEFNGGIFSFNPSKVINFKKLINFNETGITSFVLTNKGVWISLHGPPYLDFYNFTEKTVQVFQTSPISYAKSTLPYYVVLNDSRLWFNEHYANRMGSLSLSNLSLTEYDLAISGAKNLSSIDNALTFSVHSSNVCFTELTSNAIGCIDIRSEQKINSNTNISNYYQVSPDSKVLLDAYVSCSLPQNLSLFSSIYSYAQAQTGNFAVSLPANTPCSSHFMVDLTIPPTATKGEFTLAISARDNNLTYTKYVILRVR